MVVRQMSNVVRVVLLFLAFFLSLAFANDTARCAVGGEVELGHSKWEREEPNSYRRLEILIDKPLKNDNLENFERIQRLGGQQPAHELRHRTTPTEEEVARVTAPPPDPLSRRQDQSQIDQLNSRIQSLQQSAQSALQSLSDASRQVSQASQQLSQSSQQLSQQSQSLSQASQQLSQDLQQATQSVNQLTQAVSSASSALASCTASAAAAVGQAASDASTRVDGALAQATLARVSQDQPLVVTTTGSAEKMADKELNQQDEANEDVQKAQASAVSITQAAAAIIGTFVGSSLLTILAVVIFLRLRWKKKRRDREAAGLYNRRYSSNSMEVPLVTRDLKVAGPESPISRASTTLKSRFVSKTSPSIPPEFGGSTRIGTTTGYATWADRAPPLRLAEPPPARKKWQPPPRATYNGIWSSSRSHEVEDEEKERQGRSPGGSASRGASPRGLHAQQAQSAAAAEQSTTETLRLSGWLQKAVTVSPFGPLEEPSPSAKSAAPLINKRVSSLQWPLQRSSSVYSGDTQQEQQQTSETSSGASPSRKGLTEAKWPLQDQSSKTTEAIGMAVGDPNINQPGSSVEQAVVRNNPAKRNMASLLPYRGIGLPGVARKISAGRSEADR